MNLKEELCALLARYPNGADAYACVRNVVEDWIGLDRVATLKADMNYKKACELMIARGDAQTCKHAMRAITDKAETRRQFEFNMAAERFLQEDTTEEERALIARYVRNLEEVRAG